MTESDIERAARAIWAERSRRVVEFGVVPALHLLAWKDENEFQRESVRLEAAAAIASLSPTKD